MPIDPVKEEQRQFFGRNKAGCAFAAYAAKRPEKYGWLSLVLPVDANRIADTLRYAIDDPSTQALSMIFPDVDDRNALIDLVSTCLNTELFSNDEGFTKTDTQFVRLRAQIRDDLSWVTGFGPFDFLPKTRQAPYCELTIRVKPRPPYDWFFKPPVDGIIHLADLSMQGLSDRNLWKLWGASFETTRNILGHAPDEESAAKTTFVIPLVGFSEPDISDVKT